MGLSLRGLNERAGSRWRDADAPQTLPGSNRRRAGPCQRKLSCYTGTLGSRPPGRSAGWSVWAALLWPVENNDMNGFTISRHVRPSVPSSSRGAICRVLTAGAALLFFATLGVGCIERTVTINTEPQGATVFLNDQEVGQSPVKTPFTWYGDYDIIIRKKGYKSLHTNYNIRTPWYELPGLDLVTECLVPFTVHDDRVLETFALTPAQPPSKEELLEAAARMRERAISNSE